MALARQVYDDFNRADGALVGGASTPSGHTWEGSNNTTIGSNQAYPQSGSLSGGCLINVGRTTYSARVKFTGSSNNNGLFVRASDAANGIWVTGNGQMHDVNGTSAPQIGANYSAFTTGDVLRVDVNPTALLVYKNDVLLTTTETTARATASGVGLITNQAGVAAAVDDFEVWWDIPNYFTDQGSLSPMVLG